MKIDIEGTEVSVNGGHGIYVTGNAKISLTDCRIHDCEVDGIHIDSAKSLKIKGGKISTTGRTGIYVKSSLTNLHDAGLSLKTPIEVVKEASEILSEHPHDSPEEKIVKIRKLKIMSFLGPTADLATIVGLLIQIGASL